MKIGIGNRQTMFESILRSDQKASGKRDLNRLHFLSMLRPDIFRGAILLGAHIEDSLLYRWLTHYHNYTFEPFDDIAANLRAVPGDLGKRLKVSYLIADRNASKYLLRNIPPNPYINENGGKNGTLLDFIGPLEGPLKDTRHPSASPPDGSLRSPTT